ncbi:DUF6479 family protein [Streptomyces adelaidensis]|uniref:DUF6479 family protein n=1 Tax=Streptomyces adelaidensis TaxID=2796465 RepID=UPI001906CB84|nr:DUF6479 family protein [Streptomyces adelaidensis]
MTTIRYEAAATNPGGGLAILIVGLVVAGGLIWAVRLGMKVRRRESRTPRRGEHPTGPADGPVRETREMREPDEVPRAEDGSERLTPHDLHGSGSRPSQDQKRPRWDPGSGGSFGSGGPGST